MKTGDVYHLSSAADWRLPECGARLTKWVSPTPIMNEAGVNCPDCLNIISRRAEVGVGGSTPTNHTPPRMEDERGLTDGVFIFYGTHSDLGGELEVVPMTTGNVEFTISSADAVGGGLVFNLSHLDRADLIRALLHDFHYSPERGGPADD